MQEELVEEQVEQQDVGGDHDELKYDEGFGGGEYVEELAEDFVAMIPVECVESRRTMTTWMCQRWWHWHGKSTLFTLTRVVPDI